MRGGPDGIESLLYYLIAYGATAVGLFAVLAHLNRPKRPIETVDDLLNDLGQALEVAAPA